MSTVVCTRLNEIHIESILNDHDTFLFDCDGVLWCSPIILPGAIELLNYLTTSVRNYLSLCYIFLVQFKGKRVLFVTNNSLKTQRGFSQWLNEIGYPAKSVC
jgi:4-nitrophenyl phosphatase